MFNDYKLDLAKLDYMSSRLPYSLDGFKIALMTDLHIQKEKHLQRLETELCALNDFQADILLLGGDYSYHDPSLARKSFQIISQAFPPNRTYAVLGNHDNAEDIIHMKDLGINCLCNVGISFPNGLYLAGTEDIKTQKPDIERALASRSMDDFVILLVHNPDTSELEGASEADLILCGHTHGGQMTFFGLWSLCTYTVSKYGNRYRSGLVHRKTDVFISNGYGNTRWPRFFARRQINRITLYKTENKP